MSRLLALGTVLLPAAGCVVEGTAVTPPVELWVYRIDFEQRCWCGSLELLDGDLWAAYVPHDENVCDPQVAWASPTIDGDCVTLGRMCGGIPDDPWLAPCETLPGCCEIEPDAHASCQDVGLVCSEPSTGPRPSRRREVAELLERGERQLEIRAVALYAD